MNLWLRFLSRVGLWTAAFLALVLIATLLGGERAEILALHVMRWTIGALTLACFPAGISVASQVISWTEPRLRSMIHFTLAAGLVALIVFLLRGFAGPAVVRAAYPELDAHPELEPAALTLPERIQALAEAETRAERGPQTVDAWLPANRIGWEMDGTLVGALLAGVLAGLGVLTGVWARWTKRRELRQAQYWLAGLFLVVTGYGMGENSYELILLKMAGPAYFAAWFPLIGPGMLFAGMLAATVARLLEQPRG